MTYSTVRLARFLALVLLAVLLHGCAGYRLGSSLPGNIKSVYVKTFVNECGEPELESVTTSATIAEFQKDGTLSIAGAKTADAVLIARLTDYSLKTLRYSQDNTTEPSEYRLTITAGIILSNRATEKVILEYPTVIGKSTFELEDDLATAKANALPEAANDLAHDIVERVVEGW